MKKYLFFVSFLSFILYYFLTLCLSFAFLSNAVVKNDSIALEKYIDAEELKKNFYYEIYDFGLNQINKFEKNFKTQNNSIEFSGELTDSFFKKIFTKIANNISQDFSNPKIMLYF